MRIAVNTRLLITGKLEGMGYFIQEILRRLVDWYPEHEFHFLFDRPYDHQFVFGKNVVPKVLYPPARHPFLYPLFFDVAIPRYVKKIKADIFLSLENFGSSKLNIPQYLCIHDIAFKHYPSFVDKRHLKYYETYIPRYLQKSQHIFTVSEFSKKDVQQTYQIEGDKLTVVYNGIKDTWLNQNPPLEKIKMDKPYIIVPGSIHPRKNPINALKAFSKYRSTSKHEVALVFAGRLAWQTDEFMQMVQNNPYREDIYITDYLTEEQMFHYMKQAELVLYPSLFEGFGVPVLEAMYADVPVLCSNVSSLPEVGGKAAQYFDPNKVDDICLLLERVLGRVDIKEKMIAAGRLQRQKFSWDASARIVAEKLEL